MAITEENRHNLYDRLIETLGAEEANTLMEHLPPVGWADVATKSDLRSIEAELRSMENAIRADFTKAFGDFRDEIHRDRLLAQRQLVFLLAGMFATVAVSVLLSILIPLAVNG